MLITLLLFILAITPVNAEDMTPSYICIEAESGLVLQAQNPDQVRPPASMLKLMMMLLIDEGIDSGQWTYDQQIPVSLHAERMGGTQVYLKYGETWPLYDLMQALTIASANDAAMAIVEALWKDEATYRQTMYKRSQELGMKNTRFYSVHGLPPDPGEDPDKTTARDMALLAQACVNRPRIMAMAGQKEFQFRPEDPIKYSTNKLLWRMPDCDGLKTGYIRAAGFCIAATAKRNGIRLISVVMGSPSKYGRFNLAQDLMDDGFNNLQRVKVAKANTPFGTQLPVLDGLPETVALIAQQDLELLIPTNKIDALTYQPTFPSHLEPPLKAGTTIGTIQVQLHGQPLGTFPATIAQDLKFNGWKLRLNNGTARWEGLE